MSINTTPFLHLPQWNAEEKPSFLAEINQGYASIDAGVRANQVAVEAAQTAAEAAKNQADEAVEQGHTNAAGLVSLQQQLNNLAAVVASASAIKTVKLNFVKNQELTQNVTLIDAFLNYNNTCGSLRASFKIGPASFTGDRIKIGVLTGFPTGVMFKNLAFMINIAVNNNAEQDFSYLTSGNIDSDGTVWLNITNYNVTPTEGRVVWTEKTFPVQTITAARSVMVDNCLYIQQ